MRSIVSVARCSESDLLDRLARKREALERWAAIPRGFVSDPKVLRTLEQRGLGFSHAWYSNLGSVDEAAGLDDFGTKDLEREALQTYARHWGLPSERLCGHLAPGGCLAVLDGISHLARFCRVRHRGEPIALFTQSCHYAIPRVLRELGIEARMIPSNGSATQPGPDYEQLEALVRELEREHPGRPILHIAGEDVFAGTIEDLVRVDSIFARCGVQVRLRLLDAARFGGWAPWAGGALTVPQFCPTDAPGVLAGEAPGTIHAMLASVDKPWAGPVCAAFLIDKAIRDGLAFAPEIHGASNPMFEGTRSGEHALFFWALLHEYGEDQLRRDVAHCLALADQLKARLRAIGAEPGPVQPGVIVTFRDLGHGHAEQFRLPRLGERVRVILSPSHTAAGIAALLEAARIDRCA